MQIPAELRPWRHNLKATAGGDEQERETPFLPFLLGIGEIIMRIEKKLRGKRDEKSICWKGFFQHQFSILRKGGKGIEKNPNVSVGPAAVATAIDPVYMDGQHRLDESH